ncbi:MAG: protein-disulfide reductase DsbD family protein [Candidatus Pacebacteria bacterium]|nr:protein-disulfide reductase DsbD family protein [Candidatus Paceibacterota bacterium]
MVLGKGYRLNGWFNLLVASLGLLLIFANNQAVSAATLSHSPWYDNPYAQVRLVDGGKSSPSHRRVGLEFNLSPGWHIYWRNPGAAGLPPKIDWQGSSNIDSIDILWPAPSRLVQSGLDSFIYQGQVTLPLAVRVGDPARPSRLKLALSYAACSDICIPYQAVLELPLAVNSHDPSAKSTLDRAMEQLPLPRTAATIAMTEVQIATQSSGENFLELSLPQDGARAITDLLVDGKDFGGFGLKPSFTTKDGVTRLVVPLVGGDAAAWQRQASGAGLQLTLLNLGGRAMEVTVSPPLVARGGMQTVLTWQLLWMVILGLVGGLILNLMPCVLPVLSFKIIGAVQLAGGEKGVIRRQFLATAAGVVSSFLLLAMAVVGLRFFGMALGWGGQFQQPWFLGLMIALLLIFGLNLLGLFRLMVPRWLAAWSLVESRHPLVSAYLAGVFATLLATPCTAPVVGVVISFALASQGGVIIVVFAAMGLGMASPYLLAAVYPRIVARLPRPGRWMEGLRRGLGVLVLLTAVWLLWVLVAIVRPERAVDESGWQRFTSESQITESLAAGRPVFVHITADWCLTCIVNKRLVLDQQRVRERFEQRRVTLLRGDWTRPDPFLAGFMARHGRYAIPYDQYFDLDEPRGVLLPEILTVEGLLARVR